MSNAVQPVDPEIKELAFVCYVEAGYNISRAHRLLQERLLEDEVCPDRSTISRWVNKEAWDAKADQLVADEFPNLRRRQLAILIGNTTLSLEIQQQILRGELDHLAAYQMQARVAITNFNLQTAFGIVGGKAADGQSLVPQQLPEQADGDLTPAERAERQRQRLEAHRQR